MSRRKDRSPCKEESAELTVGEFASPLYEKISTDNEAPDTYCSVETEPNISYQTVIPAAKDVNRLKRQTPQACRITEKCDKEDVSCKRFICILVTIILVTLISLVCLAVLFAEIAKLKNNTTQSIDILHNQIQQLSNTTLQHIHEELLINQLGQFSFNPAVSCSALPPSSPSGYYWVRAFNDSPTLVYCSICHVVHSLEGG